MGLKHIQLIDVEKDTRWDHFVERHPFGWVCHLSTWKQALEKNFRHMKGYYFAIVDKSDNEIHAALPVYTVKSWLTGNRLVSIPFATLCDPLISKNDELNKLLEPAISLSTEIKSSFIEIRTLLSSELIKKEQLGKKISYKQHFLHLNDKPENLKKKFHRTCIRQRINRAEKSNLKLRVGKDYSDLNQFYRLHLISRKRLCLPPQPFLFFKSLWDLFSAENKLTLLLVRSEEKYIAGLILFKFKDRVSAEFAVSDEKYKNLSPNHFIFWEAIKMSYNEGYKIFDFGRTSPSNKSLMDFKKRWATVELDLPQYYYPENVRLNSTESENSLRYRLTSKMCEIAPSPALKLIGNFCYRHLG